MSTKDARTLWDKSTQIRFKLLKDWRVYNDAFAQLSNINKPSLLIKGKYDPITCEIQTAEFMNKDQGREIVTFDFSGHYVRIEEPDKYCEVVSNYICKNIK